MYKSPLLLPLFSVVFQRIYVRKVGGWCNSPRKTAIAIPFWLLELLGMSFRSIWPSFIEIGEIACITSAWSSGGHALNFVKK